MLRKQLNMNTFTPVTLTVIHFQGFSALIIKLNGEGGYGEDNWKKASKTVKWDIQ